MEAIATPLDLNPSKLERHRPVSPYTTLTQTTTWFAFHQHSHTPLHVEIDFYTFRLPLTHTGDCFGNGKPTSIWSLFPPTRGWLAVPTICRGIKMITILIIPTEPPVTAPPRAHLCPWGWSMNEVKWVSTINKNWNIRRVRRFVQGVTTPWIARNRSVELPFYDP